MQAWQHVTYAVPFGVVSSRTSPVIVNPAAVMGEFSDDVVSGVSVDGIWPDVTFVDEVFCTISDVVIREDSRNDSAVTETDADVVAITVGL